MDKKRLFIYPVLFIFALGLATYGFTRWGKQGLLLPLLVTLVYFTAIFLIATKIKDNSIVDMGWGLGFVIGSLTTLVLTDNPTPLSYLIVTFIAIWGIRLSFRLVKRNWGRPEDFRYANWRKEWGDKVVLIAFFRVFMVQAIINFTVGSAAYSLIKYRPFPFTTFSTLLIIGGLAIALLGLFFEVVGDEQLRRHIKKGSRTLIQTGLWSMTRHPNYFGEILIWWGLYISSLSMMLDSTASFFYSIILLLSPAIMTLVLIKISTPLLEKHMSRYAGWEDYKKQVPMIFPFLGNH